MRSTSRRTHCALRYAAALCGLLLTAPATGAAAGSATTTVDGVIELPLPAGTIPVIAKEVVTPERLRTSRVPGPVRDTERIAVLLRPDGRPEQVVVDQRIELTGTGDYVIRERGPALRVTPLEGTVSPIIQRGAVVWQGFVPGRRLLAARIQLDAEREAPLLPLRVELAWMPQAADAEIAADGTVPAPGRLVVRLVNQTELQAVLPTGEVDAARLAGPLDRLLRHAEGDGTGQPPAVGRGLPARLPARDVGRRTAQTVAPLRVTGTVRIAGVPGVTATGPGVTPISDGARIAGVLSGTAEIALEVPRGGGRLEVDLSVVPSLDPRTLRPPTGRTWADWAATDPDERSRRAAVDTLVGAAAAAARADAVAPYLGHPGPGPVSTVFRYSLAPPPPVAVAATTLQPRPAAITLAALAALAIAGNLALMWRRL